MTTIIHPKSTIKLVNLKIKIQTIEKIYFIFNFK